jgi:hypothetical protein
MRKLHCHRPPPGLAFGEPDNRLLRVSSTPRLLGTITNVSGILGRPTELVTGRRIAPTRWRAMTRGA